MRSLDSRSIQRSSSVRSHQRNGVWSWRRITLAATTIIEGYRPIPLLQRRPRAMPKIRRIAESHDEQNGIAASLLVPVNPRALILQKRHSVSCLHQIKRQLPQLFQAAGDLISGLEPHLPVFGLALDHALRRAGKNNVAGTQRDVARDIADHLLAIKDEVTGIR